MGLFSGEAWAEKRPGAAFEEILTRFSERRIGRGPWWWKADELLLGKIAVGVERGVGGIVGVMGNCVHRPAMPLSLACSFRKAVHGLDRGQWRERGWIHKSVFLEVERSGLWVQERTIMFG